MNPNFLIDIPDGGYELAKDFSCPRRTKSCNCPNCYECLYELTSHDMGVFIQHGTENSDGTVTWTNDLVTNWCWDDGWSTPLYGWFNTYVGNGCFRRSTNPNKVCRTLNKTLT